MKFVLDRMLGRLAKWLRVLGYDAIYERDLEDGSVIRYVQQGYSVLTRGNRFAGLRLGGIVRLHHDRVEDQLLQLHAENRIQVDRKERFSRCIRCNEILVPVSKEEARKYVPEYVYHRHDSFRRCPGCNRFYWPGTHLDRMTRFVDGKVAPRPTAGETASKTGS